MPIDWSGLAPELLLALDRHSVDPLHSQLEGRFRGGDPLRRRVTLRDEPGAAKADSSTPHLFRSRNSSLPRSSLSLSRSLIAAGLVDRPGRSAGRLGRARHRVARAWMASLR